MQPVYIQHLLKVLLEEYEDIDFLLESIDGASKRDTQKIKRLLERLNVQNDRLLTRFTESR